jgi:Cu2+-containing amine oxidase
MHIGFNYREGIVLSTVQYFDKDESRYRPIFYRASFAEMVVPYAAPEWPHPRKFAFDVGEYGLGMMANSLELGCASPSLPSSIARADFAFSHRRLPRIHPLHVRRALQPRRQQRYT